MTGALAGSVMGATNAGSGGGTGGTGGPWAWGSIFGARSASDTAITIAGVGAGQTLSLTATKSGPGSLYTIHNGVVATYVGAFTIADGDTLAWGVQAPGDVSGTITVSGGGLTLATITYELYDPNNR